MRRSYSTRDFVFAGRYGLCCRVDSFGGALYLASRGVQALALDSLPAVQRFGVPTLLAVAGLFKFGSLKYRCLDRCRSPLSFVLGFW
jgi:predicted metal-binding membrane protein